MSSTSVETKSVEQENRPGILTHDAYGKSQVRLTKVTRLADRHDFDELCVNILLEGFFAEAYITGDNSKLIATDSMKNTVYVLAAKHDVSEVEQFGKVLANHFLATYKHVETCTVSLTRELWQRIVIDGKAHKHAFFGAGSEKRCAVVTATRQAVDVVSHVKGLTVVKTTDSEFWGYLHDEYTTLPECKDRILGTSVDAGWSYGTDKVDYSACYEAVRNTILEVFAVHKSLGVQHTMHEIGQTALEKRAEINEITMTMPNQHRIPFNLKPFGIEDKNEIFVAVDEPFGLIAATIKRRES